MGDSQRFALENSPQIAKIIVIHQNFCRYCRKAILYPIWGWKAAKYLGSLPVSRTPPPTNISVGSFQFMAHICLCIRHEIHYFPPPKKHKKYIQVSVLDEGISVSKSGFFWVLNNIIQGLRDFQFKEARCWSLPGVSCNMLAHPFHHVLVFTFVSGG